MARIYAYAYNKEYVVRTWIDQDDRYNLQHNNGENLSSLLKIHAPPDAVAEFAATLALYLM